MDTSTSLSYNQAYTHWLSCAVSHFHTHSVVMAAGRETQGYMVERERGSQGEKSLLGNTRRERGVEGHRERAVRRERESSVTGLQQEV